MPVERTIKRPLRQLTLTGSSVPNPKPAASKTSSKSKKSSTQRVYTDTILTIKPHFAELIAKREKNHEYRKYELRDTVERLWLYQTAPVSAITHVIRTDRPKRPGEVQDPSGIGNNDFDNGLKQSKFGFPVLGLYELKAPLKTAEMKSQYDISPPQGYLYAPQKLVEELKIEEMTKLF